MSSQTPTLFWSPSIDIRAFYSYDNNQPYIAYLFNLFNIMRLRSLRKYMFIDDLIISLYSLIQLCVIIDWRNTGPYYKKVRQSMSLYADYMQMNSLFC